MDTTPYRYRSLIVAIIVICMVAIPLLGCDEDAQSPEEVVTSWITDLRRGERDRAMEAMWPATREQLEAAYDDLETYLGEPPPMERSDMLVVTRLESPMLISSVEVNETVPASPSDGEELVLTIEFRDDRTADISVRWGSEQKRWFVDLPIDERQSLQVLLDSEKDEATSVEYEDDGGEIEESDDAETGGEDESESVIEEKTGNE